MHTNPTLMAELFFGVAVLIINDKGYSQFACCALTIALNDKVCQAVSAKIRPLFI